MGGKEQHNGRISSGNTATPPSQGGVNIQPVNITRPPKYILTVGFEVNYPNAYVNRTQDLSVDYGHAFFYITKDDVVTVFFSFGPNGAATPGKFTDEYTGRRPGNTSYGIGEITELYRFTITEKQAKDVKTAADAFTAKVNAGKEFYTASMNDTCAETARDILAEGGVSTPNGSGPVKGGGVDWVTTHGSFVNPYRWNEDFLKEYGPGITYLGPRGAAGLQRIPPGTGRNIFIRPKWILSDGDIDPLISNGHGSSTQGSLESKK